MHPHGVGRIGQASGRESIGSQQVAELILEMRLGYGQNRKETCSNRQGKKAYQNYRERAFSREECSGFAGSGGTRTLSGAMGPPALESQVLFDFRFADYTARPIKQVGTKKR